MDKGRVWMAAVFFVFMVGTASGEDQQAGDVDGGVARCPDSPNCVSSMSPDEKHRVEPFVLVGDANPAWKAVRAEASELVRSQVVEESGTDMRLECRSRLFGFVDDVHLALDADAKLVHVRSASRTGYWDLGVNRKRIERLRERLREKGVVR